MSRHRIGLVLHFIVAAVLVAAAVPKLWEPVAFAEAIMNYRLIPWAVAAFLAGWVPLMELLSAAGLFLRRWRMVSALWIALFLITFIGLHLSVAIRGIDLDCGCFGALSEDTIAATWWFSTLLNLALLSFLYFGQRWRRP